MTEKYKILNDESLEFFENLLKDKVKDKNNLDRCKNELKLLYETGSLFIIEALYLYKKKNKHIKYFFKRTFNNLLILYLLKLNAVDPIKYNLPYYFFNENKLDVAIINEPSIIFICYELGKKDSFKVIAGNFQEEDIEDVPFLLDHYIFIPYYIHPLDMQFKLRNSMFETVEDFRNYKNEYLIARISEIEPFVNLDIKIENAFTSEFELMLKEKLKPKTFNDYVKIISLAHGTNVWSDNQDKLFEKGKINIKNIISNREDIYELLLDHSIDEKTALRMCKVLFFPKKNKNYEWKECIKIMNDHNIDDMYIDIFCRLNYIAPRGQYVNECLIALDKKNYV